VRIFVCIKTLAFRPHAVVLSYQVAIHAGIYHGFVGAGLKPAPTPVAIVVQPKDMTILPYEMRLRITSYNHNFHRSSAEASLGKDPEAGEPGLTNNTPEKTIPAYIDTIGEW
jgi:hypothetical protein